MGCSTKEELGADLWRRFEELRVDLERFWEELRKRSYLFDKDISFGL